MKMYRIASCRLGRVLLVSALMSSTLVKSAVGEALVLHQHGCRDAHLHVLGDGELSSGAAGSSQYGHCKRPKLPSLTAPEDVRILLVVTTGSKFVLTPRSASGDPERPFSPIHGGLLPSTATIVELQEPPTALCLAFRPPAEVGHTSIPGILLRNHALLV